MSRYEGLWEKADYVPSMVTPRMAERKCFKVRGSRCSGLRLPGDDSFVASSDGETLAVEILEQRDGVFARNPGEVLECRDVD
jgi:hypothetical protein